MHTCDREKKSHEGNEKGNKRTQSGTCWPTSAASAALPTPPRYFPIHLYRLLSVIFRFILAPSPSIGPASTFLRMQLHSFRLLCRRARDPMQLLLFGPRSFQLFRSRGTDQRQAVQEVPHHHVNLRRGEGGRYWLCGEKK